MVFLLIAASLVLGLIAVLRACQGGAVVLTPPVFFLALLAAYVVIPTLAGFYWDPVIKMQSWNWFPDDRLLVAVLIGWWSFVIGAMTVVHLSGGSDAWAARTRSFAARELLPLREPIIWAGVVGLGLTSLVLTMGFFYSRRETYLAMLVAEQIGGQRQSLRAGAGPFIVNFTYVLPWIALITFLQNQTGGTRVVRTTLVVSLVVATLAQAALLFRGNLVFFMLLFVVATDLIKLRLRPSLAGWGVFILLFVLVTTATRIPRGSWGTSAFVPAVMEKLTQRLSTPIRQLAYVLDTFPRSDMQPGTTQLMDVAALGPGYDVTFNGLVYSETGHTGPGTATVTVIGEAYATAGMLGVAVELLLLGAATTTLYGWLLRGRKSVIRIFFASIGTVYIGKTVLGGITAYFIQPALIFILASAAVTAFALFTYVGRLASHRGGIPIHRTLSIPDRESIDA